MKKGVIEIFPPEIMFWRTRTGVKIDVIEKMAQRFLPMNVNGNVKLPSRFHSKRSISRPISNV